MVQSGNCPCSLFATNIVHSRSWFFANKLKVCPSWEGETCKQTVHTVKPVLSDHLKTNSSLMKAESIAECSLVLQYFWPALSDNGSWKPILVFYLNGCLKQVVLYLYGIVKQTNMVVPFSESNPLICKQTFPCISEIHFTVNMQCPLSHI